jgi:hypothetical protein
LNRPAKFAECQPANQLAGEVIASVEQPFALSPEGREGCEAR